MFLLLQALACLVFFSTTTITTETTPTIPSQIIFHINTSSNSSNNVTQQQTTPSTISLDLETLKTFVDSYKSQLTQTNISARNFLTANNILVVISILSAYKLYCFWLAENLLNNMSAWCNWNASISYDDLSKIPQETLLQELLYAIEQRYIYTTNFKGLNLDKFKTEILKERELLEQYLSFQNYITPYITTTYFCHSPKKIQEKLNRIELLLKCITTWYVKEYIQTHRS